MKDLFERFRDDRVLRHTSDYVLDELATLLFRRVPHEDAITFMEALFEAADGGDLQIHRVTSERFRQAWTRRKRFDDKSEISFTDLTSMVLLEEHDLPVVVTDDEHFTHVDLDARVLP